MKTVSLGEIATFVRGVTFKPEDVTSDGVGLMRTKNVQETLDLSDVVRIPAKLVKKNSQYLQPGDTLISSANSWNLVGKACWVDELVEPLAIGGFVTALRPDTDRIDPRYLYRWFTAPRTQALLRSFSNKTTSISNLNLQLSARMPVPVPPREAQQRIAEILDQADTIRTKRRQVLAHLDTLTRSIFHDMFGDPAVNDHQWPFKELGELAVRFSDGPFGSNLKSSHYVPDGVRVIRLQNIGTGRFIDDDAVYVTSDHLASLVKHRCLPGDVLIGTLGEPNLRACVQPHALPEALNKADCVQMRVDARIAHREWVCWLLNMPGTLAMANSMMHGQTRTRVSMGQLRRLRIPVAPLDLQRKFAAWAEQVAAQRAVVRRTLESDNELFASLQARAFRGEL
jgi:type I restriction enzyme S subunit